MKLELQKILDKIAQGALTIDQGRNELDKLVTKTDAELYLKNNLTNRLSEILVSCAILMDDLNEFVENGIIMSPVGPGDSLN